LFAHENIILFFNKYDHRSLVIFSCAALIISFLFLSFISVMFSDTLYTVSFVLSSRAYPLAGLNSPFLSFIRLYSHGFLRISFLIEISSVGSQFGVPSTTGLTTGAVIHVAHAHQFHC
jgi:hypothetical protein